MRKRKRKTRMTTTKTTTPRLLFSLLRPLSSLLLRPLAGGGAPWRDAPRCRPSSRRRRRSSRGTRTYRTPTTCFPPPPPPPGAGCALCPARSGPLPWRTSHTQARAVYRSQSCMPRRPTTFRLCHPHPPVPFPDPFPLSSLGHHLRHSRHSRHSPRSRYRRRHRRRHRPSPGHPGLPGLVRGLGLRRAGSPRRRRPRRRPRTRR